MNNPLSNFDTAPIESAVGSALEIVTDRFTDVSDTLGDRMYDDVLPAARRLGSRVHDDVVPAAKKRAQHTIPVAKKGAQHTQTFVRTRTRVSVATVAGLAFAVALVVWLKKRRSNDEAVGTDAEDRRGPRSVA